MLLRSRGWGWGEEEGEEETAGGQGPRYPDSRPAGSERQPPGLLSSRFMNSPF